MRFVGSTLLEVQAHHAQVDRIVDLLRQHLKEAVAGNESVLSMEIEPLGRRVTVRFELEARGVGYVDEIAEAVLDRAIAATEHELATSPEAMTVLGSSLLPA